MRKHESDSKRIRDVSAHMSEFFDDYVVIGRIRDGLVWRFSDRTFALGAAGRLADRLTMDDLIAIEESRDERPGN